jgi:uncharacterized membrane protein YgcG
MSQQFTSEEQQLIERLQNAPQPNLKPAVYDAIRAGMFEAMDAPPPPSIPQGPVIHLPLSVFIGIVVVVVGLVIAVIVLNFQLQTQSISVTPSPIFTPVVSTTAAPSPDVTATAAPLTPSQTATAPGSAMPSPTSTAVELSATATSAAPSPTVLTPTVVPVLTTTLIATQPTPEIGPTTFFDDETIVVVEGPVTNIAGNIITVFDLDIVLTPGDPILTAVQIGDEIRVQGAVNDAGGTVVIVAITVVVVNVDVEVGDDGQVWRDSGDCSNPPPDWAPANGWRRRCEGGGNGNQGGGNGRGNGNQGGGQGMGRGNDDDDD